MSSPSPGSSLPLCSDEFQDPFSQRGCCQVKGSKIHGEPRFAQWIEAALYCLYRRRRHNGETQVKKEIQQVPEISNSPYYFCWRLEKFSNRDFLRWEKVAELFYAPERENSQQNSSLIRNLLLNSKAQDFWFCETQFCAEKDLNRNLVTQEGAKILFPLKSTCKSPFPNIA